jgi:putative hemolysin
VQHLLRQQFFNQNQFLLDYHSASQLGSILLLWVTQMPLALGLILLFLLIISACLSGAEVAFFSLTPKEVNKLKTKTDGAYKRIARLLEDPKTLLASLLICNSFVNIGIIIVSNFLIDSLMPPLVIPIIEFLIKVVVVTALLVLFAEVLPKVWAKQDNIRFAYSVAWLVDGVSTVFGGMSRWMVGISDRFEKRLGHKSQSASIEELGHAIDITTGGDTTDEEKNILKGIIKFGNISVKQIMRSRLDVSGIENDISFSELRQKVTELHYSRIPVFRETMDEVVGIVFTKDLLPHLEKGDDFEWQKLIRQPFFVHEQKPIEDLLKDFQAKRSHFAVVVDEFGGTSGIVTLEDVMEEVIGDIKDEFDEDESGVKKVDDNTFIFDGKTNINDACRFMALGSETFELVRGGADSLAGLVLEIKGDIPKVGEVIQQGDFEFTVLNIERNRLEKIKVIIKRN